MGKVRAKTLGDEEQEQKERDEAEKRRLAKIEAAKAEGRAYKESRSKIQDSSEGVTEAGAPQNSSAANEVSEASFGGGERQDPVDAKPTKKQAQKAGTTRERSEKYNAAKAQVEKKAYSLAQALELLEKVHLASFDETVELHINTNGSLNGSMNLPHGTGKSTRVAILAPSKDAAAADALLKEIEAGKINFDVLVATPDAMPRLAKVARLLGPRGLMPNPKNGTVTPNPEEVAKKYEGGHMTFKTEAKAPVLHLSVGKLSFGKEKLSENIAVALKAVETKNMKKVTLKSTMSPAVRLSI